MELAGGDDGAREDGRRALGGGARARGRKKAIGSAIVPQSDETTQTAQFAESFLLATSTSERKQRVRLT
jgi:hypothetical protein